MRFASSALVIARGFLEDNAVGTIDAEAPYFVLFGVQLFYVQ